ncbi:MAG TPA: tetratricopeptide repeat protein [Gaiellales bacterium]|nr:tetratricopeptide repeat protein [Gaiellales bacterium]
MGAYSVARLDEIPVLGDGGIPCRPVRHHFGLTSFGLNAWTGVAAGDRILYEHDEANDAEELYLVHAGRATFELDGNRVDAPAGTFVFAPPGVRRTAFAEEPGTTILAIGGRPGEAWQPDGWELWAPVTPLYEAGRFAEAADRSRELAEANPGLPMLRYMLACCELQAGRPADAIEQLEAALVTPRMRAIAGKDPTLDPIRGESAFQALLTP